MPFYISQDFVGDMIAHTLTFGQLFTNLGRGQLDDRSINQGYTVLQVSRNCHIMA